MSGNSIQSGALVPGPGGYVLEEPAGKGGMGEVWRATDTRFGRPVAIKFLAADEGWGAQGRARFQLEARAASALNHPNIMTVFDSGEFHSVPYLVTEWISGGTLRQLLMEGPRPVSEVVDIAKQALLGLKAAHQASILHRDVKPENLMIREDGFLKILDFGMAKVGDQHETDDRLTGHGQVLGTLQYMSPEQIRGEQLDGRTDLFSLGLVLYEILVGRAAYSGPPNTVLAAILQGQTPDLSVLPVELRGFIGRALESHREQRFTSAAEMLQSLGASSSSWAPPMTNPLTSLIVLPFSASDDDQELAMGVTDELIARLGRLPNLRVLGRSTSMRYRDADPMTIGGELNVQMALEGRLRQSGSRVRLTAGLSDTREGFQVWSDRFACEAGDIFDMEDQLAGAIVSALQESAGESFKTPPPESPAKQGAAYAHYLRAAGQMAVSVGPFFGDAVAALEQALELEPGLACAQAKLSQAYLYRALASPVNERPRTLTQARLAAEAALKGDPSNPDALVALSALASNPQLPDLSRARSLLRRAVQAAPSHGEALSRLAYSNILHGNCKAGIALARLAIQVDPVRIFPYGWLCVGLASQGKIEQALDPMERALRIMPDSLLVKSLLLWCDVMLGRMDRAQGLAKQIEESPYRPPAAQAIRHLFEAASGRLTTVPEFSDDNVSTLIEGERVMADAMALAGQPEASLNFLRSAMNRGYRTLCSLDTDPLLASVRSLPEFTAIRKSMATAIACDEEFEEPALALVDRKAGA